ncbi:Hypothetical predicted protein, partial [Pelobates cultripes]
SAVGNSWHLNESLLDDPRVTEDLTNELPMYFHKNGGKGTAEPWVWEVHKGITRGTLIKWGARIKRERATRIQSLTEAIHIAESAHKATPTPDAYKTLTALRMELRNLLTAKAHRAAQLTKGTYYAHGNKSGKYLARALKDKHQKTYIFHITTKGVIRQDATEDIAKTFFKQFGTTTEHTT